jgi:hypothetical protein
MSCKTLPDAESANVVGEIRGSKAPDEIVVIGGHLDSWDVGTGAHDDGAGCAISMEALRLIRSLGLKPKRTIRAVLFTNEENGLRGGKGYADAHATELDKHVAAIESDSGGARPLGFGVSAGPGAREIVSKLAAPLAVFEADDVDEGGGGADISPMAERAGVPQLGLRQDSTHYFDVHHTMADTLDKVDAHDLAMNATAMAVMAWQLANLDPPLARFDPDQARGHDEASRHPPLTSTSRSHRAPSSNPPISSRAVTGASVGLRPCPVRESSDDRLRRRPRFPQLGERDPAMPFRESHAIVAKNERHVSKRRCGCSECTVEQELSNGGRQQIVPSDDLVDLHRDVVDDHRQLIRRHAIGSAHDEVADRCRLGHEATVNPIFYGTMAAGSTRNRQACGRPAAILMADSSSRRSRHVPG